MSFRGQGLVIFRAGESSRQASNNQTLRSKKMIKKFFLDETGLELSEYAVAAALVAMAVVVAFSALGTAIDGKITDLGDTIESGAPPAGPAPAP